MRCRTEIEVVLAHQAVGKVTYAQTVIAMACVLRHLILLLRDRIEVGKGRRQAPTCADGGEGAGESGFSNPAFAAYERNYDCHL